MKRNVAFKKIISLFLCLCLLTPSLTALVSTPAMAASTSDLPDGFHGYILEYGTIEVSGKTLATVKVSTYNIGYSMSHVFYFKYDTEKVVPAMYRNGFMAAVNNPNFVVSAKVSQSMIDADQTNWALDSNTDIVGTSNSAWTGKNVIDEKDSLGTGTFSISINQPNTGGSYDSIATPAVKLPQKEIIELCTMYFAGVPTDSSNVQTTTSIPEDLDRTFLDFCLDNTDYPLGYAASETMTKDHELSEPLWLGFRPAPEKSGSLTVTVKNGASSSTTISNMNVALTGTSTGGTAVSETGTTGSDGTVVFWGNSGVYESIEGNSIDFSNGPISHSGIRQDVQGLCEQHGRRCKRDRSGRHSDHRQRLQRGDD